MKSKVFTPVTFGPLTLRNRTIRSAAFESMCPGTPLTNVVGLSPFGSRRRGWHDDGCLCCRDTKRAFF